MGLKDGDWVKIKSMVGEGKIRVRLTEGIHPSCVWLPSGYGIFSKHLKTAYDMGLSYNDFLPTYFDPTVGHAMSSEIVVQVKKASIEHSGIGKMHSNWHSVMAEEVRNLKSAILKC